MTFATQAATLGKQPCWIVEIDLDYVTSSTSATNGDGSRCYKTPTTSQGFTPLTIGTRTIRFQSATCRPMQGLQAAPSVESVKWKAEVLQLGEGLGKFGGATITLTDHQDDDSVEDPYYASRPSPIGLGSYWRRLKARHPYFVGRTIRVLEGYHQTTYASADWRMRTYEIRSVQGPDQNGRVTIEAVNPLQLLNLSEIEAPAMSDWRLSAGITAVASEAYLESAATGDPASGELVINEEIMTFTRSGTTLSLTARGRFDTVPSAHEAGDGVQPCLFFDDQYPDQIIETLLQTYGDVPSAYIPSASWASVRNDWLGTWQTDWVIPRPEKIVDLVREIARDAGLVLWWDPFANSGAGYIQMRAIRPVASDSITEIDDEDLLQPVRVTEDPRQRVSRADVFFALRTPVYDPEELNSYRSHYLPTATGEGEGEWQTPARKQYRIRTVGPTSVDLVSRFASIQQGQLSDGRIQYHLIVTAAWAADRRLADVLQLETVDILDDDTMIPAEILCQIVSIQDAEHGHSVRIIAERFPFTAGRYAYLCDTGTPVYASANTAQRDPGWFLSDTDGDMPNGDPGYALN